MKTIIRHEKLDPRDEKDFVLMTFQQIAVDAHGHVTALGDDGRVYNFSSLRECWVPMKSIAAKLP